MNKHRIIAGIVSPYGERWKEPANSQAIAGALDQMKVVKPKKWRESWTDCLECLDGRFNKAIEYSLKMVRLENSR